MPLAREKKIELLQSIRDENFFRKEVMIPLFRNMENFIRVVDHHGPNEKGTDIVLIEEATFGGYRYTSVILKTLPINNRTDTRKDRETAANVLNQIALAATAGYQCNLAKRKVDFQSILVVTNQTISNTAQEMFNTAKNHGVNDIRHLQQSDLIDLIDKYLPNFYFYHSGANARIAAALQQKCEQLSDLQNIPQFTVRERALVDVFVKPQLRRIESRWVEGQRKNEIIVETPDEVIAKKDRLLIIGESGSGKSVILRETVLRLLAQNTRDNTAQLPLLIKAHDLARAASADFDTAISEVVQHYYNLPDFDLASAVNSAKITLLIDGLDEIHNVQQRERFRGQIIEFGAQHSDIRVVVTSRRTQDLTDFTNLPSYDRWEILPFNFTQARDFVEKWFRDHVDSSRRLLTALEDHNLLSRLPNTPLVLTLLAILYDSDDYREIPSNLAELYTMFLDLLLGKWSLDRRVETMHSAPIREYLAMEIALEMHTAKRLSITQEDFAAVVRRIETERGIPLDIEALICDFTEQTALLVTNEKSELEFRHLSFQEFLVGLAVYKRGIQSTVEFLIKNFEDSWWTKVLYFYCGLKSDTPEVLRGVIERVPTMELPKQITSILELGYLVQASYFTAIETRIDVIHEALILFHQQISEVTDISIDEQKLPSGVVYFAFVYWLSMQYSSRMLQPHYRKVFDELVNQENKNPETTFAMLALAIFMGQNEEYRAMSEVHKFVKDDSQQLMALNIFGQIFLDQMPPGAKVKDDVKELRSTVKKVQKWFRNHPSIARSLMDSTNPALVDSNP